MSIFADIQPYSKEFLMYPSKVLAEIKSSELSHGAKHCWELLLERSKFNAMDGIKISISHLRALLKRRDKAPCRRTIQRYIKELSNLGFLRIEANYNQFGRIENTYSVQLPKTIIKNIKEKGKSINLLSSKFMDSSQDHKLNKAKNNAVSSKCNKAPSVEKSRCDKIVTVKDKKKDLKINNNYSKARELKKDNCCSLKENKEKLQTLIDISTQNKIIYYPAKEKLKTKASAVLRHCLNAPQKFEKQIGVELSQSQETVIEQVATFFSSSPSLSSIKELMQWIKITLLNPNAFSNCGKIFLHKLNAIIKKLRNGCFTKPFTLRYKNVHSNLQEEKPTKDHQPQSSPEDFKILESIVKPFEGNKQRRGGENEKIVTESKEKMDRLNSCIENAKIKLAEAINKADTVAQENFTNIIQIYSYHVQQASLYA